MRGDGMGGEERREGIGWEKSIAGKECEGRGDKGVKRREGSGAKEKEK